MKSKVVRIKIDIYNKLIDIDININIAIGILLDKNKDKIDYDYIKGIIEQAIQDAKQY